MTNQAHTFFRLIRYFVILFTAIGCLSTVVPSSADEYIFVTEFGSRGTAPGQFDVPIHVAVDSQDRIIVSDFRNDRIQICDEYGTCKAFGSSGSAPGQFSYPFGVAVDSQDRIIVTDRGNDRIQVCSDMGVCTAFGSFGTETGQFSELNGAAVDNQDRIIIADDGNNRIQICDQQGTCNAFGGYGTALGQFDGPMGVVVDGQGRIIVSDTDNDRVQICDEQGVCTAFGGFGTEPGKFDGPQGVAIDSQGRIIVADSENNDRIQVCDDLGNCTTFGSTGRDPGQFSSPAGVAVDSQDRIIVADWALIRIQIFKKSFQINPGLNDAWYNPDTSGQGFFINVFPDLGAVSLAWFTYDTELPPMVATANLGDAGHRWLTAVGPITDNHSVMEIEMTSGGLFDSSAEITRTDPPGSDGTIILTFDSCNSGTVEYDIPSINRQGIVPIRRVAGDNIVICEALR